MKTLAVLSVLLVAATAAVAPAGQRHPNETVGLSADALAQRVRSMLPDYILAQMMDENEDEDDDQHSKLERILVNTVLTFRDRLSRPQPEFGLPALDPFEFTEGRTWPIDNSNARIKLNLKSFMSRGLSKFKVDKLDVYLLERLMVLDISLPAFSVEFVVDFPRGSWVTPLKVPIDEQVNVRFYSPEIKLFFRGEVAVKDNKLSMDSTNLVLNLGDFELMFLRERTGTSTRNDGILDLLADVVHRLMPRVIKDWTPVVEKMLTDRLDEKLQELQIGDLIDPNQ